MQMKISTLKITNIVVWLVSLLLIAGCDPAFISAPDTEELPNPTVAVITNEVSPHATTSPSDQTNIGEEATTIDQISTVDLDKLKNYEYRLKIVEEVLPESKGFFQLKDGVYEYIYPDSAVGIYAAYQQSVSGDLNGDGLEDAVVLMAINTGGTGVFLHMVVFLNQGGDLEQAAELLVEDRTIIDALKIDDGVIYMQRVSHRPEDAMCCPSEVVDEVYVLEGNQLKLQP
jgi:hypothetical protein